MKRINKKKEIENEKEYLFNNTTKFLLMKLLKEKGFKVVDVD